MQVIRTIKPGAAGSRRFERQYGESLVAVRYRKSQDLDKIYTTIEIIVDTRDAKKGVNFQTSNSLRNNSWVAVRIAYHEQDLRQQAKALGARWSAANKV